MALELGVLALVVLYRGRILGRAGHRCSGDAMGARDMTDATVPTSSTWSDSLLAIINTKPVIALVTAVLSAWGVTWWQGDTVAKEHAVQVDQAVRSAQISQAATETMARDAVDVIIDACVAQLKTKKK